MRLIDADEIVSKLKNKMINPQTVFINTVLLGLIDKAPTVDAIPVAVIKRAISGISLADQCDQAGRYELELRAALERVLKWYGSPEYKEHERRTR